MTKANRVHSTQRRTASKRTAPPTKKSTSPPARSAGTPPTATRTEHADPIWAAIEKHRTELAAYHKAFPPSMDVPDGAINKVLDAGRPLFTTRPATLACAIAVLR
jgi:hypothetical protein